MEVGTPKVTGRERNNRHNETGWLPSDSIRDSDNIREHGITLFRDLSDIGALNETFRPNR
jgi:hypothetical protein